MSARVDIRSLVAQLANDLLPGASLVWEQHPDDTEVRVHSAGETLCVAYVSNDTQAREAVAHIVSVVQDAATEWLSRAVPDCPGHLHPASPRVTSRGVAWTCPANGGVIREHAVPPGVVAH